jgi:uncharacterized protein YcbK (DUF882 family)
MLLRKNDLLEQTDMSRRGFLTLGLLTAASAALPSQALGAVKDFLIPERSLSFHNTHTGENLQSTYWCQGTYRPEALLEINRILRDHRTGDIMAIDTELLDLLYALQLKLDNNSPLHIISGYRSPKTNSILRTKSNGVAKKSLHTHGKAIDIRIPGCELKSLHRTAIKLKMGGVGFYPRSNFVHLDVGRVRYWRG